MLEKHFLAWLNPRMVIRGLGELILSTTVAHRIVLSRAGGTAAEATCYDRPILRQRRSRKMSATATRSWRVLLYRRLTRSNPWIAAVLGSDRVLALRSSNDAE